MKRIRDHFAESAKLKLEAAEILAPEIARAAGILTECLFADGKILACGNGGSAADAQHFAAELGASAITSNLRSPTTMTSRFAARPGCWKPSRPPPAP